MSLSHGTVSAAPDNEPLAETSRRQHTSRYQPGLLRLCVIEGCERFAATSLGSLLVLYMTEEQQASPSEALRLVGNFNALCYLAPIIGGAVSDRLLGAWRAMPIGAVLMIAAYSVLGLGLSPSLLLGLVLLIAGHGLFKPSINTLLSRLYPVGDHRRETAHSWFYFAVNVGTVLAPLVAGLVRVRHGFGVVFSVAALSMSVAIVTMFAGVRKTLSNGAQVRGGAAPAPQRAVITPHEIDIVAFVVLLATVVIAGAAVAQCNGVLLLWARDDVRRVVFDREIPVSWFSALPALLVLAAGPFLTFVDGQAARGGQAVSARSKILAGLRCIGLAFLLLALAARWRQTGELIGLAWVIVAYLLLMVGELLTIPFTQALLVELVPPDKTGLASGLWFAALAGGHWMAGAMGVWWSALRHDYFFAGIAILSSVMGILARRVRR